MSKSKWEVIHECDDDDGNPTEWALTFPGSVFYWIDLTADGTYDVIDNDCETVLANCKSLASAKRWVAVNIGRP